MREHIPAKSFQEHTDRSKLHESKAIGDFHNNDRLKRVCRLLSGAMDTVHNVGIAVKSLPSPATVSLFEQESGFEKGLPFS
jgi:hypothetical protein